MRRKKTFDAVAFMRQARERLEREWQDKPRAEEIVFLRTKYGHLAAKKLKQTG